MEKTGNYSYKGMQAPRTNRRPGRKVAPGRKVGEAILAAAFGVCAAVVYGAMWLEMLPREASAAAAVALAVGIFIVDPIVDARRNK